MFRQVTVLLYGKKIGYLRQQDTGFTFEYLSDYKGIPLSLSFPVEKRVFHSAALFPYFASLAPEGWLRSRVSELQKIDEKDLFGMLIQNGSNLLGAVQLIAGE
ncbi:type II toxin-antitoxin system HipA family toxin [Muribacter muris]|uniref:Type II toxin-antitoxin system HipA family toxin n=1 Tax=Muribacter muris TaxID=67855 RepID=A0A4Y9JTV4_9PAST|nr:HipA N-terminal domain-containing protein [Muribacter muris]MBF0785865.1 HipA N-terminal domain-containing protein [Muribacter muris]MBF0827221.1 HipA N-terminal domain-containing protein [Muribacter muris]TFV08309.1 type II toxin-antitoxin system HipA family toxin [Muribacter muris]